MVIGEWGIGAPKETSLQSRYGHLTVSRAPAHPCPPVLASIPRFIKSPPGGNWGIGVLIIFLSPYIPISLNEKYWNSKYLDKIQLTA